MEIGDGGGESWRRRSKESSHLRDFIQLKQEQEEEVEVARRNSLTGLTLSDVLGGETHRLTPTPTLPVQSNRTLLDIIQEEEDPNNSSSSSSSSYKQQKNKTTSWKAFTEKLRLSLTITATVHIPNPNHRPPRSTSSQNLSINGLLLPSSLNNNNQLDLVGRESLSDLLLRSSSTSSETNIGELNSVQSNQQQQQLALVNSSSGTENGQEVGMSLMALLEGGENGGGGGGGGGGETEPDDVGISLMALLEETDREIASDEEEEEEEVELVMENEIGAGGVDSMKNMRCCICMVREKGAAFIPCGHAFCRICSRELWLQRGTCPLCNASILEILHIF